MLDRVGPFDAELRQVVFGLSLRDTLVADLVKVCSPHPHTRALAKPCRMRARAACAARGTRSNLSIAV